MRISKPTTRKFMFDKDPDGASVTIRSLTPGERTDITDQVLTQEIEYRPGDSDGIGRPVFKQTSDKKKDRHETFKARIVSWEKHFDEDGNPMDCTPENIVLAMRKIEGWTETVNGYFEQMDKDLAAERKAQEKN